MKLMSQADISRKYNVSRPTVNRWIKLTEQGTYNLELSYSNNKVRVIDNENNSAILATLAIKGRAYKPSSNLKRTKPTEEFDNIFTKSEQIEIFTDLLNNSILNLKYWYKSEGATQWDNFYKGLFREIGEVTEQLLEEDIPNIVSNLEGNVNIIDIGSGNGYPARRIINHIQKYNKVSKYVSLDISEELSKICSKNIAEWFPNLKSESFILDVEEIEHKEFTSLILGNRYSTNSSNLILYIGNTLSNQQNYNQVLNNFRAGMMKGDVFAFTVAMDTISNRASLSYISSETTKPWILKVLGIDVQECSTVVWYDDKTNCKYKATVLDKDYEIVFDLFGTSLTINLRQGDRIVRWRDYLFTIPHISQTLDQAELSIANISLDKTGSNALVICKVK